MFLRSAWRPGEGRLFIDTLARDGMAVEISAGGWARTESVPVAFKRVPTTAPLPISSGAVDRDEALDLLRSLVPISGEDVPVLLALLLSAWLTGVPQPVVLITGPSDSGKTTTARFLLSLVDPTTHRRGGGLPSNELQWKALANTGRALLIDNLGHVTAAQSDLMCRVSTGGELTTRALYTDDTAHVTDLQVPLWLTSVDTGVLREDLATRIIKVELRPLDPSVRLSESELAQRAAGARPILTRVLLDLMVEVIARLPDQPTDGLTHRMGDFEQILRCVDDILGTDGVARLGQMGDALGEDVLDADPIAQALVAGVNYSGRGGHDDSDVVPRVKLVGDLTPAELLDQLTAHATKTARRSPAWPRTPALMSGHLNRVAPTLLKVHGIRVSMIRQGKKRTRYVRVELVEADEAT